MRQRVALMAVLSCIVLASCACAFALDPSLDVSQYAHTAWKVREGFPKGAVFSIAQTPDGYLWLGTESGLFRFDGVRPMAWQPPGDHQLPGNFINSLLATRDGTLWIGTHKGLASWSRGKFVRYPDLAGLAVDALLEDREGTVWIGEYGSTGGRLCAAKAGTMTCYRNIDIGEGVSAMCEDRRGNLWISAETGLWRWNAGSPERYQIPQGPSVHSLVEGDRGELLLSTEKGLEQFVRGRFESYPIQGFVGQFQFTRFLRDRDGNLWVGSRQGLLHLHDGRADVFKAMDGLSADFVDEIFEDREGNVWAGTQDGLDRFRDVAVPTISQSQGLSSSGVWSVQATSDGSVWIGTVDALNRWNNGDVTVYRSGKALGHKRPLDERDIITSKHIREVADSGLTGDIHSIAQDGGRLWISTSDGVFHREGDRFIRVPGVPSGFTYSIAGDGDGGLWMVNHSSLLHVTPAGAVQQIPWSLFGGKHGFVVMPDRSKDGGVWLAFIEGGIAHFNNGQVVAFYSTADGSSNGRVSDLRFGPRGALWASTEAGLTRVKDGAIATLTSRNGLPCDGVQWSIEDDDHAVWLSTPCGVVRIERSELDAWVGDSKHIVRTTILGISDGVRSQGIAGGYPPTVTKSPDGRIWFLPRDGVSVIDPHHLPINKLPPPVQIEQITADGKDYDPAQGLRLPAHVQHIDIDYTALSLVAPEKNRFRFKLEGYDRDWRDIGNRRQAFYTNLPPRNYRFRVMASNNSGVWNEAGASLEFSVLPAFYQTTWFRVLCGFGFLALLWGIYQFRVQQLQQQFAIGVEARVNERTRIARELHDTLLQNLHGLMFQFQAVRNLMPRRPEDAMQSLDAAIDETERTIAESRDAIQGLRSEPIAKGNLAELLRTTSEDLAKSEEAPPIFDLVEEGERQMLSPATKNEICRIALEILRNAYRHAHAHRIEAEVRYGEHALRLRIRDDGRGIDPKILMDGGKAGHWGMRGIRERAQRIGATLDFWSEAGAGTEAQLTVPATVAYENSASAAGRGLFSKVRKRA